MKRDGESERVFRCLCDENLKYGIVGCRKIEKEKWQCGINNKTKNKNKNKIINENKKSLVAMWGAA